MKKLLGRATAAIGVAVMLILALGTPAQADSKGNLYVGGKFVASGGFDSKGEIFWVVDQRKDGHSAVVVYKYANKQNWGTCWNHSTAASGAKSCDTTATEGTKVSWKVCLGEYASRTYFSCSGVRVDYA